MAIEDVFSIKGRGTVATGRIERGVIKVNEEVEIVGFGDTRKTVVTGVEMFRKLLDQGQAGDNVGCLLRGIEKDQIERGQVLAKPGTITPHKKFHGEVYVLKKEEGGRHTPFFTNYRPQFYIRTTDVTGTVDLPEGVKMVMPGDNIQMTVTLHHAGRAGGADALRHSRGRQDGRRWRRHQDSRVKTDKTNPCIARLRGVRGAQLSHDPPQSNWSGRASSSRNSVLVCNQHTCIGRRSR